MQQEEILNSNEGEDSSPLPARYQGNLHPLIPFDANCKACELGIKRAEDLYAVQAAGPDSLCEIKLVVISDHPGYYESKNQFPMYANDAERMPKLDRQGRVRSLEGWRNAGSLMRMSLERMYGLDTYREVWFTNAVRCDPGKEKTISKPHLKACSNTWTINELDFIDREIPNVPILIAGQEAFKSIEFWAPEFFQQLKRIGTLPALRRRSNLFWKLHPVVFTFNPASISRNEARIEVDFMQRGSTLRIKKVKPMPVLPGSALWMFAQDLTFLDSYIP